MREGINNLIVDMAGFISIFGVYFLFSIVFRQRFSRAVTIGILTSFTVVLFGSSYLLGINSTIQVNLVRSLLYLPLLLLLFKGNLYQKLFAGFFNGIVINILYAVALQIVLLVIPVEKSLFVPLNTILYFVFYSGYFAFILLYWKHVYQKLFYMENKGDKILFTLGMFFSYAALYSLRLTLESGLLYIALVLFILWSFCTLCYAVISTHDKTRQKAEADSANEIIALWKKHYEKEDKLLAKYRDSLKAEPVNYNTPHFCDNQTINTLLIWFAEHCTEANIEYDFNVELPSGESVQRSVSDYDICIVVGNLLDNAVESAQTLADGIVADNRKINLSIMLHNEQFALKVDYVCRAETADIEGTGPGLHSVRIVAERYGGNMFIKLNGDVFTVTVLMPLEG